MFNNSTSGTIYYNRETIDLPKIRIIDICILVTTIIGNTLVVIAILKDHRLRKSLNYLVLNLSICNILFVVTSIPFDLVLVINKYHYVFGHVGCRIISPLATMSTNASVFTLLCITIERYVAIVHPFVRFNSRAYVLKVIGATYIYSLITVIPLVFYKQYSENEYGYKSCKTNWSVKNKQAYTVALFLLQYGIPLPVMAVLYSRAWIALKRSNYFVVNTTRKNSKSTSPENSIATLRERQTVQTLFVFTLIILIFAISFLPNQIMWLWYVFHPTTLGKISAGWIHVFITLHYSNCVLNPIVYGGLHKYFWTWWKNLICCMSLENWNSTSNIGTLLNKKSRASRSSRASRLSTLSRASSMTGPKQTTPIQDNQFLLVCAEVDEFEQLPESYI